MTTLPEGVTVLVHRGGQLVRFRSRQHTGRQLVPVLSALAAEGIGPEHLFILLSHSMPGLDINIIEGALVSERGAISDLAGLAKFTTAHLGLADGEGALGMRPVKSRSARDFRLLSELAHAPGETLLTPAEVEALSGFKQVTLRLWHRQGKGPARRFCEGRPRYFLADVRAWLGAPRVAA